MTGYLLRSARFLAKDVLESVLRPGDTCVDATMGNGHDTLRMARLVGPDGRVHAFDVQPKALENTRALLLKNGMEARAELHLAGHERMAEFAAFPVRLVLFNLGWLPGSDKAIRTLWATTEKALQSALSLLAPLGVCVVCVYPGHPEGREEQRELLSFLSRLKPQEFNVLRQTFLNAGKDAPECIVIQKQ